MVRSGFEPDGRGFESLPARRDFSARRNDFPVPDHRESVATTSERLGISALAPAGQSDIGEIPCTFPTDQGTDSRDEFARDCPHRHPVCHCGESFLAAQDVGEIPAVLLVFGRPPRGANWSEPIHVKGLDRVSHCNSRNDQPSSAPSLHRPLANSLQHSDLNCKSMLIESACVLISIFRHRLQSCRSRGGLP